MTILHRILELLGCEKPVPPDSVDIVALMDAKADAYHAREGQGLDWRHSLRDLMKALDMGDEPADRRELYHDLDGPRLYVPGSASANEWARKALMRRVADNGGKVPDELL